MADPHSSFARYAGPARFPRDDDDLRDTTRCPACFTPLSAVVCTACGLDLGHEAAARLALVSSDAAGLLDERIELIGRIRFETALALRERERAAREPAPAPATVHHPPERTATGEPVAASSPSAPNPAAPTPAAAPLPPRRSSVQVALIVVGISLLSIAAVFFLVYAFLTYGIVWRSVIIGTITLAALATASLLRRRSLTSTAEGIAAFAVVLVYLDAFAVRANDLFGAAASDGLVYWGMTLVLSALGCTLWYRFSRLRVGSVAGAIAFAPGVGLVVGGLAGRLDDATRLFVALLAVAVAALVHPWVGARGRARDRVTLVERAITVGIGVVGLAGAFFAGYAAAQISGTPVPDALWLVAAVAAAHVVVVTRTTDGTLVAKGLVIAFGAVAGFASSLAIVLFAFRALEYAAALFGMAVGPTALVLALAVAALRSTAPLPRSSLRAAAWAAAAVAASMLVVTVGQVAGFAVGVASAAVWSGPRSLPRGTLLGTPTADVLLSAAALIVVVLAVAAFGRLTSTWPRVRTGTAWATVALCLLAAPLLAGLGAIVAGWLLGAAVGVALAVRRPRRAAPAWLRPPLLVFAGAAALCAYALSWAGTDTWLLGTVGVIALLVAARGTVPAGASAGTVKAALLGAATTVATVGAAAAGLRWATDGGDATRAVAMLAAVLFGAAALPRPRPVSALDRRVVVALSAVALVVALPFALPSLPVGIALLAAVLGWIVPRRDAATLLERRVAAVALAPAVFAVLYSATLSVAPATVTGQLMGVASALLAAATSLALLLDERRATLRVAADAGIALVAVPATVVSLVFPSSTTWLVLLLSAATALASAVSVDGLFASARDRRLLGWVALTLATAALWWRLSESSVTAVEPYALPLAGALLAIAALHGRARRSPATPALVLAALLVGIVPVALATRGDDTARAVVVGAIAAALLLAGSIVRSPTVVRPFLDAAAVAGFAGVVVIVVTQCIGAAPTDATADSWAAAGLVVLGLAAFGQCSGRPGDRPSTSHWGRASALTGLAVVAIVEVTLLDSSPAGFARAALTVVFLSAVHVVAGFVGRPPIDRITSITALVLATVVAAVALTVGATPAPEWVSVPIALSLFATGGLRLARNPALRSTPAIGPALFVLFVPSLLEGSPDGAPWRLGAVGVLAVVAIIVGLVRRLQAPFVAGVVVVLVHGATTFAPQIAAVYAATEWWVWLGIGGAVITVLAARYEHSLRTARNVVATIGALR